MILSNTFKINWLSCQVFEISKQALDLVRDGKFRPSNENLVKKCNFLTTPLLENGLVQDLLRLTNL